MAECASPDILDDEDVLVSSTMDTYSMCVQCGVVAKEGLMRKEEKDQKKRRGNESVRREAGPEVRVKGGSGRRV